MDDSQDRTMSCRPVSPEVVLQWSYQRVRAEYALEGGDDDGEF